MRLNAIVSLTDDPPIQITPYSPTIGGEVSGIDLRQPLSDHQVAGVRAALLDRKVLFFRDQDITTEQHLDFARNFGALEIHPFAPHKDGYREVLAITHDRERPGQENGWHSDVTWRQQPSLGSVLRCIECPPVGGDTLFADMYAAYDGLPEVVREQVEGRLAVHDFEGFRLRLRKRGATEAEIEDFNKTYPNPEHPVIRSHPETGRKGIYVNAAFTKHIVGMAPEESGRLLALLYQQANMPEYQCRFRWAANSIAFWDNRACQHYAASDYWPHNRRVERVTIIGDTPFHEPGGPATDMHESPFRGRIERQRTEPGPNLFKS
ncbi:MAG: TauD/TfdA family dioxygenase [Proteobacteria bacterium]|nr:TauD/TfdA family dioxygenase [Pseudomonadota bacterium]